MATNETSTQHAQKVSQVGSSANLSLAWATMSITTALTINSVISFMELPAGTTIHNGWLVGDDLDTGTEALEIDVGIVGNADKFLNGGVLSGDALAQIKPDVGLRVGLLGELASGPITLTEPTVIIGTIIAAAAGGGTGNLTLQMLVTYADNRVSPPTAPI